MEYDEFAFFEQTANEAGLSYEGDPVVWRVSVQVGQRRHLSALRWKHEEPDLALLHGGSQNAHTWDTVALALDRPLAAIDLPGHGHSDGPVEHPKGYLNVEGLAQDVATAIETLAPNAQAIVGMSLGGLTALALTQIAPHLVRRLVLVDVLPGLSEARLAHIAEFTRGPTSFASLDDLLERTKEFYPHRSVSSLRRGILHNAEQQPDGTWKWRWARHRQNPPPSPEAVASRSKTRFGDLWRAISELEAPLLLVRGMRPESIIRDDDERELMRRLPSAQVEHFRDAGHSVQGDSPVELAAAIDDFIEHS